MSGQAGRVFELRRLEKKSAGIISPQNGKIFAFTSGKGGTGKTFLAVNIAAALANKGKKVLLIDFDYNLSNVHILVDVLPGKTLSLFFLNKNLLPDLITEVEPNLSFIFGDSGMEASPKLSDGAIAHFFEQLRRIEHLYDFIFVDTASGATRETMEILSNADQVILSTSPEPTSVMDAYAALKLLNGTGFIGRKNIIVNKSEDKNTADITFLNLKTAVDHFLKIEIKLLGFVSNDAAVSRSIMAQVPLVKQSPDSQIAKQINDLAANLSKNIQVANIQQAG